MSTAQHRRLAKKKKAPATHSPAQQRAKKKECGGAGPREEVERPRCWSRPTRGGGVELLNIQISK